MEVTTTPRPIEQAWEEFKREVPVDDKNCLYKLSFYAGTIALLRTIVAGDHIDHAAINEDILALGISAVGVSAKSIQRLRESCI